jgi:cytochrome P450
MSIAEVRGPSFDHRLAALFSSDPAAMGAAFSLYRDLCDAGPAHEFGSMVLVTHHAECRALYRDAARLSSAANRSGSLARENRARLTPEQQLAFDELNRLETMRMSTTDGEQHRRLRLIAHRAFTPARIKELEENVRGYLDELLAQPDDVVDLMELAYQLPLMAIVDLLGVPQAGREQIHLWSTAIGRNRGGSEPDAVLPAYRAVQEFSAYVRRIIDGHRRATAPTQLVAALMDAEGDDQMTVEEVIVTYMMLLFAGHETTTNLIGAGMLELLRRPEQWRLLTEDPSLAVEATEELLRFVTPVQWNNRVPVVDVEIAGMTVPAGRTVRLLNACANRDAAVFAAPDELDLLRANARDHLALGYGQHFCLGNALARLEGAVVFGTLAERFPSLTLTGDEPEWTGSAMLRRLRRLPVRLGS